MGLATPTESQSKKLLFETPVIGGMFKHQANKHQIYRLRLGDRSIW